MNKNDKTIYWIIGIILFIIVATQLPGFHFPFAIITQTTCAEGVTNYYSLDGNLLDSKNNLDATNYGAVFVAGKINQGLEFNGSTYISFPSIPSNLSILMWINNYSSPGWYYASFPLSSTFGLNFNGSIDEIVIGTNVSGLSGVQACYQITTYENVTCKDYATSQVTDQTTGCLNYSEGYFPNCTYKWENQTTYRLENNACKKNFYCVFGYSTQSECSTHIVNETAPTTTTTEEEQTTFTSLATKEIFNIGGYSITAIHLIIALIIIVLLLWMFGAFGGK